MEWLIFGTLVIIWNVRLLEAAHALGFFDKRSQSPSGLPPRTQPRRTRQRRHVRRSWQVDYVAHLEMGNDTSEQLRLAIQMLERNKKKNPVADRVDWKKEGF